MIRYLKNENEYYKWCCNNKWKYFIYKTKEAPRGKIKIEYYKRIYDVKINQYTLDNILLERNIPLVEIAKRDNIDMESLFIACTQPFGKCCGYKWEFHKEGDV